MKTLLLLLCCLAVLSAASFACVQCESNRQYCNAGGGTAWECGTTCGGYCFPCGSCNQGGCTGTKGGCNCVAPQAKAAWPVGVDGLLNQDINANDIPPVFDLPFMHSDNLVPNLSKYSATLADVAEKFRNVIMNGGLPTSNEPGVKATPLPGHPGHYSKLTTNFTFSYDAVDKADKDGRGGIPTKDTKEITIRISRPLPPDAWDSADTLVLSLDHWVLSRGQNIVAQGTY